MAVTWCSLPAEIRVMIVRELLASQRHKHTHLLSSEKLLLHLSALHKQDLPLVVDNTEDLEVDGEVSEAASRQSDIPYTTLQESRPAVFHSLQLVSRDFIEVGVALEAASGDDNILAVASLEGLQDFLNTYDQATIRKFSDVRLYLTLSKTSVESTGNAVRHSDEHDWGAENKDDPYPNDETYQPPVESDQGYWPPISPAYSDTQSEPPFEEEDDPPKYVRRADPRFEHSPPDLPKWYFSLQDLISQCQLPEIRAPVEEAAQFAAVKALVPELQALVTDKLQHMTRLSIIIPLPTDNPDFSTELDFEAYVLRTNPIWHALGLLRLPNDDPLDTPDANRVTVWSKAWFARSSHAELVLVRNDSTVFDPDCVWEDSASGHSTLIPAEQWSNCSHQLMNADALAQMLAVERAEQAARRMGIGRQVGGDTGGMERFVYRTLPDVEWRTDKGWMREIEEKYWGTQEGDGDDDGDGNGSDLRGLFGNAKNETEFNNVLRDLEQELREAGRWFTVWP